MDRYKFANELFDLRFYSEYNVILHQTMAQSSHSVEMRYVVIITFLSLIALIASAIALRMAKSKKLISIQSLSVTSLAGSAAAFYLGLVLSFSNSTVTTAELYQLAARWQETNSEVETLGIKFKEVPENESASAQMNMELERLHKRQGVLDELDTKLPPSDMNLETDCYGIATERIYGKGIKTQLDVENLKKSDFDRWARPQFAVDPRQVPGRRLGA